MSNHGHDHSHRAQSRRALGIVLGLTAAYTVCEIVGGWLTGSLALLADAGHMLGDTAALALALVAAWLAGRPATPERSFGYRRAEILAALVNGVAIAVIAVWVFIEAVRRLDNPKEILGGWMLAVALVGLVVNAVATGATSTSRPRSGTSLRIWRAPSALPWPRSSCSRPAGTGPTRWPVWRSAC
jgi:cobalt-zinc-cadmium efflux system protein